MSKKISVTLTDDLFTQAHEAAGKGERTVSSLCRFALRLYLTKYAPMHAPRKAVPVARKGPPRGFEAGDVLPAREAPND